MPYLRPRFPIIKFCGFGFYLVMLEFELRKQEECCGCVVVTCGCDWQKVHSLVAAIGVRDVMVVVVF